MSETGHFESTVNLDPAERDKFNALALTWWDPEGDSRPLHEMNPARIRYIAERTNLKGADVTDVGCGGGILSEALAHRGAEVTGIDIAEKALMVARLHLEESGQKVTYINITAEQYANENPAESDVVTCLEMLEHVPEPDAVVNACARMLRPGGHLFLSTLNRTPLAFGVAIVGAEHLLRLLPRGTHRYDRFIRPSEISKSLRSAGLEVMDVRGIHYNPLSRSTRLGGHLGVNYLVHAMRPDS
ncbi:MAG: bifunctional 2-polyprenyl-6-hydroxyphenol methylase/3-demethylubiquinol 3-O-methyltransferase UbiG [Xanthomonadales bacterium]|nr:bifunctional 2-polyprenyl-6-hydroxyphenol methylase/3-demethylubiquinol 3-O-methyltransferase UbiG [Xanthomonadales bacterium]